MARQPNVLWIQCDELRADALGCYADRYDVHLTPNLDGVAERGVRFTEVHNNSPVCVSSRTSMLTGRYPHEIGVYHNEAVNTNVLPPGTKTFPEVFAEAGYRTVNVGKIHTPKHDTWSEILRPGPRAKVDDLKLEKAIRSPGPPNVYFAGIRPDDVPTYTTLLGDKAVEFLSGVEDDRPWLFRVSFVDPHTPVVPPARFAKLADEADFAFDAERDRACESMSPFEQELSRVQRSADLTPEQIARCRAHYFALTAHVDDEVGRILAALEKRGLTKDTIVYFDADHGAMLGENGLWQKQSFQSTVTRSPYLISWPGTLPEGEVRTDLAQLLDTGPTLLGLCGIERDEGRRGRDLFGDEPEPEVVFGAIGYGNEDSITYPLARCGEVWPRRACIRTKTHRLGTSVRFRGESLTGADRRPDLIDLDSDPNERTNVYDAAAYGEVRDRLERALDNWLQAGIEVDLTT